MTAKPKASANLALPEGRGSRIAPKRSPKTKTAEEIDEAVRKERGRESAKAAVRRSRERGLKQLQEDPNDPKHGTATGYIYGCRCESCRENWNKMRRSQDRKAKRARKRTRRQKSSQNP